MRTLLLVVGLFLGFGISPSSSHSSTCDWGLDLAADYGAEQIIARLTECLTGTDLDGPARKRALKQRALSFGLAGRFEEAIADRREVIRSYPEESEGFVLHALIYLDPETFADRIGKLADQLDTDRSFSGGLVTSGNVLNDLSEYRLAMELYDQSLVIEPRRVDADLNRGAMFQRLGANEEAISAFQSALNKDPDQADALHGIATSLYWLGRKQEALEHMQRALDIERSPFSRGNLLLHSAEMYLDLGDPMRAITLMNAAVEEGALKAYNGLFITVSSYEALGKPETALAELDAAELQEGASSHISLYRGDVLCRLGRNAEAEQEWALARSLREKGWPSARFSWMRQLMLRELGYFEGDLSFDFDEVSQEAEQLWIAAGCPWYDIGLIVYQPGGYWFLELDW